MRTALHEGLQGKLTLLIAVPYCDGCIRCGVPGLLHGAQFQCLARSTPVAAMLRSKLAPMAAALLV